MVYFKTYALVRYNSLKSLKNLEKCLQNFKSDPKSQLKFLKTIFLNISEDFMKHLLSKVLILNKENCNEFFFHQQELEINSPYPINSNENCNYEADKENYNPNYPNQMMKNRKKPLKDLATLLLQRES